MIKIISGAQTGVDQAGLVAARLCDLETGGYVTKGNLTQEGFKPELIKLYNLTEMPRGSGYKERTWKNVETADLTIRIFTNPNSPGEICTLNAIKKYRKEYIDIDLNKPIGPPTKPFDSWIGDCLLADVINIAGNSEKTSPGIFHTSLVLLYNLFKAVRSNKNLSGHYLI